MCEVDHHEPGDHRDDQRLMQPDAHELLLQRLQSYAIKRNQMQSSAIRPMPMSCSSNACNRMQSSAIKRLTSPLKIPNASSCIVSDSITIIPSLAASQRKASTATRCERDERSIT